MLYVGFSNYSHKIHAQLFCRNFKHCAPIIINNDSATIYQFVHVNKIVNINIKTNDLKILQKHGWKFVKLSKSNTCSMPQCLCFTCVQFTKHVCGIKDIRIQTPMGLFKYLNQK